MRLDEAFMWALFCIAISSSNLIGEVITVARQDEEFFHLHSSDTGCQVERDGNLYILGGSTCAVFPTNTTIKGTNLKIINSRITALRGGDFDNLSHLKTLIIDLNPLLRQINEGTFALMSNLENLTITNNEQLMYIYSESLAGLKGLKQLVLSKNAFMEFYFISQAVRPEVLPSLTSLDVSGNTFRCINYTDAYHMNSLTLKKLKLSSSSIAYIEGNAFNNIANLSALYIDNNDLRTDVILNLIQNISLHSEDFNEIHIGENGIADPNDVFSQIAQSKISKIDLSFSSFAPVICDSEAYLPDVVYLDLTATRSRFPSTYFSSDRFPKIEYLYLSSNYLLGRPLSMSLPTLRYLDLSNNCDSNFYYSVFNAGLVFNSMTSLEFLKLDSNPITDLLYGSFQNLSQLRELHLANTSIQHFDYAPFLGLDALEVLDLSQNNFYDSLTINNWTFIGLSNLKTLILDGSSLTCLADDDTFIHTPKLQQLSIRQNTLLELHQHLLHPVPLLNFLDLSYNRFQSWGKRLFERNNELSKLDLSNNQISIFTTAMLQDFSSLETLNITKNTLSCDCSDISSIFPYINSTSDNTESTLISALSHPEAYCSLPSQLRFSSFLKIANKFMVEEKCKVVNKLGIALELGIIGVSLAIVVCILVFYFLRWHIKYWIFLMRQAMSGYIFPKKKTPAPSGKYVYDAFVSYSNEDRGFVVRLVSMLENQPPRFRLCVFERDFDVGGVITNNVVECLAKSRRTILVLSDSFARSTWCQWEMNLAQHKRLFFKDDQHGPLVIIKIGEIMEKHMTPTLRYLTKTRIYLQWNSDPIKQKVFWEKLRSALAAPLNEVDEMENPPTQHAVLSNGGTVNTNVNLNFTSESIDV